MAFAGHLKSINLHRSHPEDNRDVVLTTQAASEKERLQQQMQEKAAELSELRNLTVERQKQQALRTANTSSAKEFADDAFVSAKCCEDIVDDRGNTSTRSLWIGNTPHGIKTSDLRAAFGKYGVIESTKSLQDCSFVNFQEVSSAIQAWKNCHEKEIFERGRPLYIRFTGTQADSKRSKDYQTDRTAGFNQRAQAAQLEWFQGYSGTEHLSSSKKGNDQQGWPNGNPPSEPKSHRRDVSPPPLQRGDTYRPTGRPQHDVYRPLLTRTISSANEGTQFESLHSMYSKCTKRRKRSDSRSTHSSRSSSSRQLSSDEDSPHSASNSPLPWERNKYGIHSRNDKQSYPSFTSKPTTASEHSQAFIIDSTVKSPRVDQNQKHFCSSPEPFLRHSPIHNMSEDELLMTSDNDPYSPTSQVESYTHFREDDEYDGAAVTNAAQLIPASLRSPNNLKVPPKQSLTSALLSATTIGSIQAHKQRLLVENDDLNSTRSERSSLSNFSSSDRKCRACKKLGNEKGLHALYQCSRCHRRYHGFCGRPKPNDHTDAARFVCGKCIRQQNKIGRSDGMESHKNHLGEKIQLVSPPLTHTYIDNDANFKPSRLPLTLDTSCAVRSAAVQQYTPPTPAAISDHTELYKSFSGHISMRGGVEENDQLDHDGYLEDFGQQKQHQIPEKHFHTTMVAASKYKWVTCPWWRRKGAQCRLSVDECLYAHRDTGIYSPDGFKQNKQWTCFQWLEGRRCPKAERDCLYAHHDTGLYTWKDGRASLKHVTCYWWVTRYCKYDDHDCRFAHADTGLYSRDPSDKRCGMAISTHRPPSGPSSSGQDQSSESRRRFEHYVSHEEVQSLSPGDFRDFCRSSDREAARPSSREPGFTMKISNLLAKPCESSISHTGINPDSRTDDLMSERFTVSERPPTPPSALSTNAPEARADSEGRATWQGINDTAETNDGRHRHIYEQKFGSNDTSGQRYTRQTTVQANTTTPTIRSRYHHNAPVESLDRSGNSSSTNQQVTQDPRKRPHNFIDLTLDDPEPSSMQAQSSACIGTESEHTNSIIPSKSAVTVKDTSLLPSKNIRKCASCAKTVFSGRVCRDCKVGQSMLNGATTSPLARSGPQDNLRVSTDQVPDDGIAQVVQRDFISESTLERERKTQVAAKLPVKRSSSGADMFIPNKRARGSMLFSSSGSTRTDNPGTTANKVHFMKAAKGMRKAPAPTIDQLIKKRRLENNQAVPQDSLSARPTGPIFNDALISPGDKENQTPVDEDTISPSTVRSAASLIYEKPPDKPNNGQSNEDSQNEAITYLNYETGMEVRSQTTSRQRTSKAVILPKTRVHSTGTPHPDAELSTAGMVTDGDQESDVEEMPNLDGNLGSYPMQEASLSIQKRIDNEIQQDKEPQKLSSPSSLRETPFVCRNCRFYHKKCFHSKTDTRILDPEKCYFYLQARNWKRDTSRARVEWDKILDAAAMYSNFNSERQVNNDLSQARINIDDVEDVDEGSSSASDTEASEQLLQEIQAANIRLSERQQSKADVVSPKVSQATEPGTSHQTSPITRSFGNSRSSKLVLDIEHVEKLRSEGVIFESDEEDDDYLSDDQAVITSSRPPIDALHVLQKSSRDLFKICPELHPDHPSFNLTQYGPKRKTKLSRKAEWTELRQRRFSDRRELFNDPHWEVDRGRSQVRVETLIERLIPAVDAEINTFSIPSVSKNEEQITFLEFLGGPKQPEACLTTDKHLALRDGARDLDHSPFTRTLRGFGRRSNDDDKWPVNSK